MVFASAYFYKINIAVRGGGVGRVEELFQPTHPENVKGERGEREKLFGAFFANSMFNGCSVSFVRAKMLNQFDMWQQQV